MCGRYVIVMSADEIRTIFGVEDVPDFEHKFNQAPGTKSPVVHLGEDGKRKCTTMLWGLIPFWSKDGKVKFTNNARSETIRKAPTFREPFKHRRCLIPVNGFYEWHTTATGKQPYFITLQSGPVMAFAAVYDRWKSPTGEVIESFAIATCEPNEMMARIHDRMPVILPIEAWATWLSPQANAGQLSDLLQPLPNGHLNRSCVSTVVNRRRGGAWDSMRRHHQRDRTRRRAL